MAYIHLIMNEDVAGSCIREFGSSSGLLEFVDQHPDQSAFSRPFVNKVKEYSDLHMQLSYLLKQCCQADVEIMKEDPETDELRGEDFDYKEGGGGTKLLHTLTSEISSYATNARQLEYAGMELLNEYVQALERYYVFVMF